ncbi:Crp/Fnr family transcriptional regulator [Caenimonas sedimenti]|uniref:Crp/Fnr family transcriptional regulator n=1 Tax=Caenimonas sedimenti TaxID=2596921 RepID=A0A562ZP22_9BURK|nr:Crp/Fnr family transcriptional regulator [Caenimonas sedimenti]TWO70121.1 Crp/Fnr family transcriptional regulator [Caenimonas sedimenti]
MLLHDVSRPSVQFLRAQPWFAPLSEDERTRVAGHAYTLQGNKGDVMLHAGEEVKGWYAVLSGLVKIQSQSAEGRLAAFMGIPAGEWLGGGSVMKQEPRRYDVIALRETELLCLPRAEFEALRETSLAFNHALADHLNLRLGQAMAIIEAGRIRSPEQRVALSLSRMFWHGRRSVHLSQEELGILAGLSRQTVNGVLKDLERQGIVTLESGRVGIADESRLMAMLDDQ